jgi:RHS repeat-associated protein
VYFLKDHLGSVRATVDNTGAVVGYDDYDPWGYILANRSLATPWSSIQGTAKNKFTGKEWDDEFGVNWYHFPGRPYDPQIGRWLARDPKAENSPNLTPYHYTRNNPLIYVDPTGEEEFKVTVRSYIPFQRVGPFLGDARGPMAETQRFRTEQVVRVETDPSISKDPLLSKQAETGTTIALVPFSPYVLTGKSQGEFSASATRTDVNQGNNVTLGVEGSAGNPLVPFAPAIDYNFQITIVPGEDGKFHVVVSGSHDAFPAYEVFVTPANEQATLFYWFNPKTGALEVFELFPPKDVKVGEEDKK